MRRRAAALAASAAVALAAASCAGGAAGSTGPDRSPGRLTVVTTVSPITNIVATVAGTEADVVGLVPEGANSHTFEPPPSTARALSEADLVRVNGLKLEDPTVELARADLAQGAEIVELGTRAACPSRSGSTTSRSRARAASRTRTCGPTRRTPSGTPSRPATC